MESTDPTSVAVQAARGFKVFECEECAKNIRRALVQAGHTGTLLEIRGAGGREFMVCLSYDEGRRTITQNGRHLGVRVDDKVFDNLHPDGLPLDRWLGDFDALGGVAIHSAVDF